MKKIGIIALLISIIWLCSCSSHEAETVAYVNGEAIETREFMMLASRKKAEVLKYFHDKYGAEYNESFWDNSFDGESPSEVMCKLVTEELVPIKIQQKMAVDYKILDSCDYSDFLMRLEKENTERKKKKENNEIVYGVTEYSEEAYYSDETAKMIISVKDMWKKEQKIDDKELLEYYEKVKDKYYRRKPAGEVTLYIFDYRNSDTAVSLLEKAKNGQDIENEIKNADGKTESLTVDENLTQRHFDLEYPGLLQELDKGNEYTELLSFGSTVYFAKANKMETGYKKYDDIKSDVEKNYTDELYDAYIKKLVNEADIKIKYEKLNFSDL